MGSAFRSISALISSTGTLNAQSENLTKRIAEYKVELTKLEDRMTQLLARYNDLPANDLVEIMALALGAIELRGRADVLGGV